MGLKAFTPKTETVKFPGGEFAVRGLSLEDFAILIRSHYEPMSALFEKYVDQAAIARATAQVTKAGMELGDVRTVVLDGLQMAPALIGDAIARATDETENPHLARLLPVGTQIDAIEKIIRLTLEAEGGLEKLVETVLRVAGSLTDLSANRSP